MQWILLLNFVALAMSKNVYPVVIIYDVDVLSATNDVFIDVVRRTFIDACLPIMVRARRLKLTDCDVCSGDLLMNATYAKGSCEGEAVQEGNTTFWCVGSEEELLSIGFHPSDNSVVRAMSVSLWRSISPARGLFSRRQIFLGKFSV
jgi:hypothetical protein